MLLLEDFETLTGPAFVLHHIYGIQRGTFVYGMISTANRTVVCRCLVWLLLFRWWFLDILIILVLIIIILVVSIAVIMVFPVPCRWYGCVDGIRRASNLVVVGTATTRRGNFMNIREHSTEQHCHTTSCDKFLFMSSVVVVEDRILLLLLDRGSRFFFVMVAVLLLPPVPVPGGYILAV